MLWFLPSKAMLCLFITREMSYLVERVIQAHEMLFHTHALSCVTNIKDNGDNGLFLHMAQPTSRSTTRNHCTKLTKHRWELEQMKMQWRNSCSVWTKSGAASYRNGEGPWRSPGQPTLLFSFWEVLKSNTWKQGCQITWEFFKDILFFKEMRWATFMGLLRAGP